MGDERRQLGMRPWRTRCFVMRHPGGGFVVVIGPDGVGKTTLASRILERWDGPTGYFHFLPTRRSPILPRPESDPPPPPAKSARDGSRTLGWARLGRNLIRFWWAYGTQVQPLVRSGTLVIGDRWAYGYVGQPYALRFYGPLWLADLTERLLPRPDLVIDMKAPVEVIAARKQELTPSEIQSELARWSQVARGRRAELDAVLGPDELAEQAIRMIREAIA